MDFITNAIATAIDRGPERKPARPRDTQRSRVYAAERAAFGNGGPEGMTIEEVERFVATLWESGTARRARAREDCRRRAAPIVYDGRGCRRATGGFGQVTIPRWARSRWVICHEVAHCIAGNRPWHGPAFCRVYLELIEEVLGFEARERLALEMRRRNVRTR